MLQVAACGNEEGQRQNERITFAEALMESRLPAARPSNLTALHAASRAVYDPDANYDTMTLHALCPCQHCLHARL